MASPPHLCPKCRSDDIARIPRSRLREKMIGFFGWRVYRCGECRYRFYDRPSRGTAPRSPER